MLPDPKEVPQEARRKLLLVLGDKVKPSELGVSRSYLYKMRSGLRPIPDSVLEKLLSIASDDDLAKVPYFVPYISLERIRGLDVERIVKLAVEWAKAHPASAKVLLNTLERELEKLGLTGRAFKITEAHYREFEFYLKARTASGDLSPETARDYLAYLREALNSLGWVLTKHNVRQLIRSVQAEAPGKANHMYKALKLFVKEVIQDQELLAAIPRPRVVWRAPEAPSWDRICRVLNSLPWGSPPHAFLLLLASTGLRVETVYGLPLTALRLEDRLVWVWRLRRTKRDYYSFIPAAAVEPFRRYLNYREEALRLRGRDSNKLFPFKPRRLREAIYRAMDEVLGYRFQLKLIRKRVAEHLSHYLSTLELNVIMGHAPREVVEKHYLLRDQMEELRAKYDRAMEKVPCLRE